MIKLIESFDLSLEINILMASIERESLFAFSLVPPSPKAMEPETSRHSEIFILVD